MDITLKNFQKKIPIPRGRIIKAAQAALRKLKSRDRHDFSIVFVGARRMRALNKKYLQHDYVTDVLTFELGAEGEIVICPQVAAANAKKYQTSTDKELILYVVHGILHLAGFDDRSEKDRALMRRMEDRLLP